MIQRMFGESLAAVLRSAPNAVQQTETPNAILAATVTILPKYSRILIVFPPYIPFANSNHLTISPFSGKSPSR
jgi:hypothetical protein